jgi:hypothetical protein
MLQICGFGTVSFPAWNDVVDFDWLVLILCSAPRQGYPGHPVNEKFKKGKEDVASSPSVSYTQITATFKNSGSDPTMAEAELYYQEDQFWGKLGSSDPSLHANTYQGHIWNVKVGGKVVNTWTVREQGGTEQDFII